MNTLIVKDAPGIGLCVSCGEDADLLMQIASRAGQAVCLECSGEMQAKLIRLLTPTPNLPRSVLN